MLSSPSLSQRQGNAKRETNAHEPLPTGPPRDCQTPRGTKHIQRAHMLAEQGDARRLRLTGQLQAKNQSAEFRAFASAQSKRLEPRRVRGVNRRPPDGLSDPQGHRTPTERLLARERRRVLPVVVVWWPAWQCACAGISMCIVFFGPRSGAHKTQGILLRFSPKNSAKLD